MKKQVEPSVISQSQSESNAQRDKSQLAHGTTTKLDQLFHLFDQVCTKTNVPTFMFVTITIIVYFQVVFSSLYPFNKYWYEVNADRDQYTANSKIITVFHYLEAVAWYFRIQDPMLDSSVGDTKESNLIVPALMILAAFVFSIMMVAAELLGAFHINKIRKISFYLIRIGFGVLSHAMNIPIGAFFGVAVRNLVLSGNKFNWLYIIMGFLMYLVSTSYIYLGFIFLNQSTTISVGPFSSFSLKIPFLFLMTCSGTVILQCIFSLFSTWSIIIIQLVHIALGMACLYQVVYLVFHSKMDNIIFIGVLLSTWVNDIIFFVLHFVTPPSKTNDGTIHSGPCFFYMAGLVLPLLSLIFSMTASYIYVNIRYNRVLKELNELSEIIESEEENNHVFSNDNNTNNNGSLETSVLHGHSLFRTQDSALMAIHISFTNCLPLFYKWTAVNYTISQFQTTEVLMQVVHYMCLFPGASRRLNSLLSHVSQIRALNYHQRFLLF